jgi:hypothetical protein
MEIDMIRPKMTNLTKNPSKRTGDSIGSSNLDAMQPRLITLHDMRKEKRLKDELYGDAAKDARAKVTLPKFSWDKD